MIPVEWAQKAKRRRTTGTGRMRYLKTLPRRFKNGFREGGITYDSVIHISINVVLITVQGQLLSQQSQSPIKQPSSSVTCNFCSLMSSSHLPPFSQCYTYISYICTVSLPKQNFSAFLTWSDRCFIVKWNYPCPMLVLMLIFQSRAEMANARND